MQITVHLLAFTEDGPIPTRTVDLPPEAKDASAEELLDLVFKFGQNMFQSKPVRSVSVGDVIDLDQGLFLVQGVGFKKLNPFTDIETLPRGAAALLA